MRIITFAGDIALMGLVTDRCQLLGLVVCTMFLCSELQIPTTMLAYPLACLCVLGSSRRVSRSCFFHCMKALLFSHLQVSRVVSNEAQTCVLRFSMESDMVHRKRNLVAAVATLRGAVFSSRFCRCQCSLNLVDTLAAGALFSDASTSWRLSASQLAIINGRLAEIYRQVMKWKHACQDRAGHKDLCAASRGEAQGKVSMARIRFAERLSGTAPPT